LDSLGWDSWELAPEFFVGVNPSWALEAFPWELRHSCAAPREDVARKNRRFMGFYHFFGKFFILRSFNTATLAFSSILTVRATMTASNQQLSHMVYFTLHDASPVKVQELLSACHKYLDGHPGTVYFSVGTLNRDLARPVNDHGYDVVLNIVFESRQAHDEYQTQPRHLQFIEEQKPNWKQVRVFDSDLVSA
jgi:hypothetical protein